jgi:broad specificity phosphatase PhoE
MTTTRPQDSGQISKEAQHGAVTEVGRANITPPVLDPGDTCIVVQRHEAYDRHDGDRVGSLTPEGEEREWDLAYNYFDTLMANLPADERAGLRVFFTASDSIFEDNEASGERSYETAVIAQQAAEAIFEKYDLPQSGITNVDMGARSGYPVPNPELREPKIFTESRAFVDFLRTKHGGINKAFWHDFESDGEAEVRQDMGAEGPVEIASRLKQTLSELAGQAREMHAAEPGRRDVIWVVSHYDTISPFVKLEVLGAGLESELPVEYGGGIVVKVDNSGEATTKLAGSTHSLALG